MDIVHSERTQNPLCLKTSQRPTSEHFEKLLKTEADPKKRGVIERLLSAEKLKAAALRRARL